MALADAAWSRGLRPRFRRADDAATSLNEIRAVALEHFARLSEADGRVVAELRCDRPAFSVLKRKPRGGHALGARTDLQDQSPDTMTFTLAEASPPGR